MDDRDREAIQQLFVRLRSVADQNGQIDASASRLIADEMGRQPAAAYFMAQTIIMQDMALNSQKRELDEALQRLETSRHAPDADRSLPSGGFLPQVAPGADPWGRAGRATAQTRYSDPDRTDQRLAAPYRGAPAYSDAPAYSAIPPSPAPSRFGGGGFGGGGFLASAAQTAAGVAGGVVLGNILSNAFEGHGGGLFGGQAAGAEAASLADKPTEENVTINNYGSQDAGSEIGQPSDPTMADDRGYSDDSGLMDASDTVAADDGWLDNSGDDQI